MQKAPLHGLLLVDKPTRLTSHDVVKQVRHILKQKEVGHTGTLDPLASGLMVMVLGEATKLSEHLLTGRKGYQVRVKLGLETDSWDADGAVVSEDAVQFEPAQIEAAARALQGEVSWPVPLFSALKKDGRKLYEIAHAGGRVPWSDLPRKTMEFSDLQVHEVTQNEISCSFTCSKGSFVRTWAMELGQRLGTAGTVTELRRVFSDPYKLEQAVSLAQLEGLETEKIPELSAFIPIHRTLPDWHALTVKGRELRLMTNGQVPFEVERRLISQQKHANRSGEGQGVKIYNAETGGFLALLEVRPCSPIKIKRIFKSS